MNDVLNIITWDENEVIGSYKDNRVKIKTDIDIREFVEFDRNSSVEAFEFIRQFFISIFEECIDNTKCVITDFKLGVLGANVPIRWKYDDLKRGYIDIDNLNRKKFVDLLNMRSIIKIDFLVLKPDYKLQEISKNFYFIFADTSTVPYELIYDDLSISFLKDYQYYKSIGNEYKSLKRLYSYYKLLNNKKEMNRVLEHINNPQKYTPYMKRYRKELVDMYLKFAKPSKEDKQRILEANKFDSNT